MTERKCIKCGRVIRESMGFVLIRDILNRRFPVREHCGICVNLVTMEELYGLDNICVTVTSAKEQEDI